MTENEAENKFLIFYGWKACRARKALSSVCGQPTCYAVSATPGVLRVTCQADGSSTGQGEKP